MDAKKFGVFIAQCRKEKKMTQAELAERLHVSDKAISRWERGVGFPDINSIEALAEALEVSIMELMKSEKDTQPCEHKDTEEVFHELAELLKHQRNRSRRKCVIALLAYLAATLFGIGIVTVNVGHRLLVVGYLLVTAAAGFAIVGTLLDLYRSVETYKMEMEGLMADKYQKRLRSISVLFIVLGLFGLARYCFFLLRILFTLDEGAAGRDILMSGLYWALAKAGLNLLCGIIGLQTAQKVLPVYATVVIGIIDIAVVAVMQFFDLAIIEIFLLVLPVTLVAFAWKMKSV